MTTTQHDVALCEQAQAFLSRDVHHLFIDGQFVPAGSGQTLSTVNPSTGEVLARFAAGDSSDIDRAVLAVQRWLVHRNPAHFSRTSMAERSPSLTRLKHMLVTKIAAPGTAQTQGCT